MSLHASESSSGPRYRRRISRRSAPLLLLRRRVRRLASVARSHLRRIHRMVERCLSVIRCRLPRMRAGGAGKDGTSRLRQAAEDALVLLDHHRNVVAAFRQRQQRGAAPRVRRTAEHTVRDRAGGQRAETTALSDAGESRRPNHWRESRNRNDPFPPGGAAPANGPGPAALRRDGQAQPSRTARRRVGDPRRLVLAGSRAADRNMDEGLERAAVAACGASLSQHGGMST